MTSASPRLRVQTQPAPCSEPHRDSATHLCLLCARTPGASRTPLNSLNSAFFSASLRLCGEIAPPPGALS